MKRLLCFALLLMSAALAFGQATKVPTCNSWSAGTSLAPSGVPVFSANNTVPDPAGSTNCTDYFGVANWANSPLPTGNITGYTVLMPGSGYTAPVVTITDPVGAIITTATAIVDPATGGITGISGGTGGSGYMSPSVMITDSTGTGAMVSAVLGPPFLGGMPKFQATDTLGALGGLTLAAPDQATFANSDFYVIGLTQYTQKMHASLPPTTLRGYCQLTGASNYTVCAAGQPAYLGPVILAARNRPVRVLFKNMLPTEATGGTLFIPMDSTYMGADRAQNRATLHLHGGNTPWISDGTTMQWTTPPGETHAPLRGESVSFVPDMWFDGTGTLIASCAGQPTCAAQGATNDPGPGNLTFFWTNQQGGRLMFYHDHAYGITRLNVYAGEAAGYLLIDPQQEHTLAAATAPGTLDLTTGGALDTAHLVPLVIQDKTFVPSSAQLAAEDPTWAGAFGATPLSATGSNGDLWFPHVYMTNQNPADPGGGSAFGRWDYGAWFFPPMTTLTAANPPGAVTIPCTSAVFPGVVLTPTAANNNQQGCPIIPNPSGTPEGFMDTPLVNGKAYPILHVSAAAYRFQILSAGNDRSLNLQLYVADAAQGNTEVAMVPAAVPATNATTLPLCGQINPIANPALGLGLVTALVDVNGNPINATGLPAGCWPNYGTIPGIPTKQTMWAADGRVGGAPDPRLAGPPFIQIGTEGGLLPFPVVIPSTPTGYEWNPRSITITNVAAHGLWLGPAERADVIVDFSAFNGKTLILYNDAPTPAPAVDSRLDYFTGDGDQTAIGGAPNTQPGFGPNTRTIMQIVVDGGDGAGPNAVPFSLATLKTSFASTATTPGLFQATQPTIIVPEAAYRSAYDNPSLTNTYPTISDTNVTFTPIAPLTFEALLGSPGTATCNATAPAQCAVMDQKTIQELFTLDYGRMNATLGTELPLTSFQNQTTIPLGYVDPATEIIRDGDTQIWKITHNGVDTHFIHFHLVNVQVLNRIGWDGSQRPIDQNELGWKDTVRMNPLEDIIVAMQANKQNLPWPIPNSLRLMDVTGSNMNFSNLNPFSNAGATTTNAVQNFGWEYVWHCHILGHEENDMMRPIVFQVAPPAPSNLVANIADPINNPNIVSLTFTDNSANETGFAIQRDTDPSFTSPNLTTIAVGPSGGLNAAGEGTSWGGVITASDTLPGAASFFYRVQAADNGFTGAMAQSYNDTVVPLVSGWSNTEALNATPIAPTVTFTGAPATAAYNTTFTITATTNANVLSTITATGACSVGAVSGTPASATALVTMTNGTGTCTLTANWAAVGFFLAGGPLTQTTTAALATPTVSFTAAPASAAYLSTFTVTATTNASTMPTITPTGVCSVGTVSGTPANATATVSITSGSGTCSLAANWAADTNYAAGGPLTQTTIATKVAPTTTFTGAPANAVYNTSFNITATTNASTMPTIAGTAGVCSVGAVSGTPASATASVTMTSGTGTCTTLASWAADANYAAGGPVTQATTAVKAASATSIGTHTPNSSVVGQPVAVSFSVTGTTVPTGTVTVNASTGESCVGTLSAGTGSCSLTFVTTGTRTMTATYGGDANFAASTSAASTSQNVIDFVLGVSPGSQTVNGGQKASYRLTGTAIGGVPMPIALSCTVNQPAYTCAVSPTSFTPNGGTKSATITVNTVRGFRGTYTVTITGVDTQTGFTLTHRVTAGLTTTR